MDINSLNEYIGQFLSQQKCSQHPQNQAKVIKLQNKINDAFVCSECMDLLNQSQNIKYLTVKRSTEQIKNFLKYEKSNPTLDLSNIQIEMNGLKQQFSQFYSSFNGLIDNIELKIKLRKEICQQNEISYQNQLTLIHQSINQYQSIKEMKQSNILRQQNEENNKNSLTNVLLGLLSKEKLVQNCNMEKHQSIISIFLKTLQTTKNLLYDQYSQLQNLIEQENLLLELLTENNSDSLIGKFNNTMVKDQSITKSNGMFNSQISSHSLKISNAFKQKWEFDKLSINATLQLISQNKIHIPYNPQDTSLRDTNVLRLAKIKPNIQDGPLRQPREITFQINSMINPIICLGICDNSQNECSLEIYKENRQYLMFNSMGFVQSKEINMTKSVVQSPSFQRGDIITLIVSPQNGHIQLIKNNVANQPFQIDLLNDKEWFWTSMVFVVAAQGLGGGDIIILNNK